MPIRFGYHADDEMYQPSRLLDFAVTAEKQGFDFICIDDHFHPWFHRDGHAGHAWIWLAAAGAKTSRVGMGTGVTTCIHRYNPAIVAQAFATLDELYPGRVFLALGTGEAMNEMPMANPGLTWPPHEERLEMTSEAVTIIKSLWEGDFVDYEGRHFRLNQARLYTKPRHKIPLYVAASGPKAVKMAGRLGDGLLTNSDEKRLPKIISQFEEAVKESGRNPGDMPRMIEVSASYDEDYDKALASISRWLPVPNGNDIPDPRELDRLRIGIDPRKHAGNVYTDLDGLIGKIERIIGLGFTEVEIGSSSPDEEAFIKKFGGEALPYLRDRFSDV
ncbi:MAG: TIGR03557 family F420-dependent LLM class oxidoreductase [Candidatus Bathyarchaeota archaeon]|nr:TIGR03557 family F420-dependent LLM class oxidoreductase [Candidatus Bathyarchaeota archaeon]